MIGGVGGTVGTIGGTLTGAGPPSWSPADLAGLQLWLDGKSFAGMGLADGDPIVTWPDRSGNGYDQTAVTSTANLVYKPAGINGQPAAVAVGNARMEGSAGPGLGTEWTVVFVWKPDGTEGTILDLRGSGQSTVAYQGGSERRWFVRAGDGSLSSSALGAATPGVADVHTLIAADNGLLSSRRNGGPIGFGTARDQTGAASDLKLFTNGPSLSFPGAIGAVLIYDRAIVGADLDTLEAWLLDRFRP